MFTLTTTDANGKPAMHQLLEQADVSDQEGQIVEFAEYAGVSEGVAWEWYYSMDAGSFDEALKEMYEQADEPLIMEIAA